ncbi:MAG: DUF2017 family protein [Acidimicrobiales bacterium]
MSGEFESLRLFAVGGPDSIDVSLPEGWDELLRSLSEQLREALLVGEVDDLRRLYPTAYPDDPDHNAGFADRVHDQLLMQRLDSIDQLQASLDSTTIGIATADAWMSTINEMRLVLGDRLDVSEADETLDDDDPSAPAHLIYGLLTLVLGELTEIRTAFL